MECRSRFRHAVALVLALPLAAGAPRAGAQFTAPVIDPVSDMIVDPGGVAEQTVTAYSPDGNPIEFSRSSGPVWVLVTTLTDTSGKIRLEPPESVGGVFGAVLAAFDGYLASYASFRMVVNAPTHPPAFIGDMPVLEVAEESFNLVSVYATDPDGVETLHFYKADGPFFMNVLDWGGLPGSNAAHAYVTAQPVTGDRGDYIGTVGVTDGLTSVTAPIRIWVASRYPGDTSVMLQGEPGNPLLDGASFRLTSMSAIRPDPSTLAFAFESPRTPGDVELTTRLRLEDANDCSKGRRGKLRFSCPAGDTLGVGAYEGAILVADDAHPGIDPTVGCVRAEQVSGRFEVRELLLGDNGAVRTAWVVFELFANGSAAPLRGDIRFHERALPLTVYAPAELLTGVEDDVAFHVSCADSVHGTTTLQADLPPGASLNLVDPNVWGFSWRPGFEHAGVHRIVFRGSNARGDTASAFTDLTVRPRNAVTAVLDARQVEFFTSNRGVFACDLRDSTEGLTGRGPAGPFPAGTSAGLWIGALVNGAPRVALGGLAPEFVPGPAPTGQALPFDPRFKNYKVVRARTDTPDWRTWPDDQGAPRDDAGEPLTLGDMTAWSVYNDGDPAGHADPSGGTAPLGVEVRQTSWAFDHDGPAGRAVRLRFEIRNNGPNTLAQSYASIWMDPRAEVRYSIGDQPVVDVYNDLVGCDTTRALGFAYGSSDYGGDGTAVGVAILHGAVARTQGGDPLQLGMTSFRRLSNGVPGAAEGVYRVMRGLDEDGTPVLDPSLQPTLYEVPGDPVHGEGWLDGASAPGARKLFLVSTGPFDMAPGETQTIEAAVVIGRGGGRLLSITDLRNAADVARGAAPLLNAAPQFVTSRSVEGKEGAPIRFTIYASDPNGDRLVFTAPSLPEGATLAADGRFDWTPGYEQAGLHTAHVVATDAFGAFDSATFVFTVRNVNRAPMARSGGPYHGIARTAIEFDASLTSDPDGDSWLASWTFGDGFAASGDDPVHIYPEPGVYTVVLSASDGDAIGRDTTTATIAPPVEARGFIPGRAGVIRLGSPAPTATLSLEIEGGGFSLPDFLGMSFLLESVRTGTVREIVPAEATVGADEDENGVPELSLIFRKEDLRALFGSLPAGRTRTTVILSAMAGEQPLFATLLELTIEAPPRSLAVILAPNPIHPRGTLTFTTSLPGPARVSLFDVRGRLVRVLLESDAAPAGYHDVPIDGKDAGGRPLATGLYFYRIDAAEGARSGRVAILR